MDTDRDSLTCAQGRHTAPSGLVRGPEAACEALCGVLARGWTLTMRVNTRRQRLAWLASSSPTVGRSRTYTGRTQAEGHARTGTPPTPRIGTAPYPTPQRNPWHA